MNSGLIEEVDLDYISKKATREFELLGGKNIFLTGSGGFLGYYFIKSILFWNDKHKKNKIKIHALSSFRSGIPFWMKDLKQRDDFYLIKKDISKYTIPKNEKYHYIIHAASIASPTFYRLFPIETINANVQGLYKILTYVISRKKTGNPIKGLLFFSTSEIYGDPTKENIPTPETYRGNVSCTGPRACYDESKRFCETLCVNYAKVYNLPIRSARPFNNYGPGLPINDGRVIPDFSKTILSNKDIILYSDGKPTRTFCYVADAIVGYLKILLHGKLGEAYNIGTEKPEITIFQLANKMKKIGEKHFEYKGIIRFEKNKDAKYLSDNPQRRRPNIEKARKELKYNPEISLEDGLLRSLSWYKQNMNRK